MNRINRYNKALMILSLYFFASTLILGVLPYLINDGTVSIWELSKLGRVISIVIGISIFLTVFVYFYIATINSVMFKGVTRYLRIFEIISMFFIIQYFAPEEILFNIDTAILIIFILGIIIVTIDVCLNFYQRNKPIPDFFTNKDRFESGKITILTNEKDGVYLFSLSAGIIVFLFIYDFDMGDFSTYIGMAALNSFFLYKYLKLTHQSKKNIKILTTLTLILGLISISMLEIYTSFFSNDQILYMVMIIFPTIYLYPIIIRNYHNVVWKAYTENDIKEIEKAL